MTISANIIDQLLYENESATLDFKRDQYAFESATNVQKGELLKDILSFANAWRRTDAYILIGIQEVKGGRSLVIGIDKHLDDAKLQQFVNSKTQRPIYFSYNVVSFEGKDLGVIHIPPQERPLYLNKDFGGLESKQVYIRRGSSTDIAYPDEISKMGQTSPSVITGLPILDVTFYDFKNLKSIGNRVLINTVDIELPKKDEIPDYGSRQQIGVFSIPNPDPMVNRDYWRELAMYIKKNMFYDHLEFVVSNTGSSVANDVRLECEIENEDNTLVFADIDEMPSEPLKTYSSFRNLYNKINRDITVKQAPGKWVVEAFLQKVQPKSDAYTTTGLFVGAKSDQDIILTFTVRADNLPIPITRELFIEIRTEKKLISVEELMNVLYKKSPMRPKKIEK